MTASRQASKSRKRWLSPAFVSAVLSGHSALGLALSALIYVICLTGTIAVFSQELERWEQPSGPMVTKATPGAVDRGLREIYALSGATGAEGISVSLPTSAVPRLTLIGGSVEDGDGRWFADADGRPVAEVRHAATDFLVALHANLHLPRLAGLAVVGLLGVALLALLISGILAHPRIFREAFTLRWGGSRRLQEADLHNRLGTWGLPFHLLVTLSGAVLGVFLLMFGGMASTAYKGDFKRALTEIVGPIDAPKEPAAASLPAVEPIMAFVQRKEPAALIHAVEIQRAGTRGQRISVLLEDPGKLSHDERYVFDGAGELVYSTRTDERPAGAKALLALPSLHFGWFGGIFTKVAYGLLGLSLCVVVSSGVTIWLARRRDQGRPVPVWERLWTATVWGQAAAFALSAILTLMWPDGSAAALGWILATVLAYAAACVLHDDIHLTRSLRLSAAALLLLLAAAHALRWSAVLQDEVAWLINLALCAGAAVIAVPVLRKLRFR